MNDRELKINIEDEANREDLFLETLLKMFLGDKNILDYYCEETPTEERGNINVGMA